MVEVRGEVECVDAGSNRVVSCGQLNLCLRLSRPMASGIHHPPPSMWVKLSPAFGTSLLQIFSTSGDNFLPSHHHETSSEPLHSFTMRSTTALRMFRATPRMMRPVPVSERRSKLEGLTRLMFCVMQKEDQAGM